MEKFRTNSFWKQIKKIDQVELVTYLHLDLLKKVSQWYLKYNHKLSYKPTTVI